MVEGAFGKDCYRSGSRRGGASSQCLTMIVFSPQRKPVPAHNSRELTTESLARRIRISNSFFTAEIAEAAEKKKREERETGSESIDRIRQDALNET
jgi:hypothetical protein